VGGMTAHRDGPGVKAFVAGELAKRANPEKAAPMAAYMKTDMPFYGVQKPGRKEVFKGLRERFAPADAADYEASVLALWSGSHREEKYLAIDFARAFKRFITPASLPLYERLVREGAWWDFVDPVASDLVGHVLLHHRPLVSPMMEQWIHDPDFWIRRTALISQLRHKAETNSEQLFRLCIERAHEKEFFIRKAIGWALREYSKTEPQAVEEFLSRNRDQLSGLSFREGMKVIERARG